MEYAIFWLVLAQIPEPPTAIFDYVSRGGALAILVWITIGAVREWWFTSGAFHRMVKEKDLQISKIEYERDEWKRIALRSLSTTDKAIGQLEPPK